MAHEPTDWLTSNMATVAMAAGVIAFKQLAFEGQPIEFLSVPVGAGLVMGYLEWRRRQGAPGLTPTGPAPGAMARVPAAAAIAVGLFCLLHWFVAFVIVAVCASVVSKRLRAGDRPLSQALGERLIIDASPTPVVRKAAAPSPTRKLKADRPVAAPPPAAAVEADERAPLAPTGFAMPTSSVLDSRAPLELESRVPLVLESRLSALTSSLGTSRGSSGFDEALALLQSKPASDDRAD